MGVLILFPVAAALAVLYKRRFELMVFPAIGLILVALTLTGMIGLLLPGVFLATAGVIPAIVVLVRHKKLIRKFVLTPGFVAFCLYLFFFYFYAKDRVFLSDIARSQYGPSVLRLFTFDSLKDPYLYYNLNNPFPLGTLWAYFCSRLFGGYAEWKCIFSYDILILSGVLPLFCQIRSIKEENWQWLLMLAITIALPLLKMEDAYRSFDMAIPQTTALVYTLYIVYRMCHDCRRRGDVFLTAYGFFMASALTQYGVFTTLPLMAGCISIAFSDPARRKDLLSAILAGNAGALVLTLYNLICGEVSWTALLLIPGNLLLALLIGGIAAYIIYVYYDISTKKAGIFLIAAVVLTGLAILLLKHILTPGDISDLVFSYTNKLFTGTDEGEHVLGRHAIPIHDITFLFILLAASSMAHRRELEEKYFAPDTFHAAYVCGVIFYLIVLGFLYITPNKRPISVIAPYMASLIVMSSITLYRQSLSVWNKNIVLLVTSVALLACVYTDPVNEMVHKVNEYEYPVIHECLENGAICFTGEDRVFYMDPELHGDLSTAFRWEVFPAGADTINSLYFNTDPYRWSDGQIPSTMTPDELAELLREGGYTYLYLNNIVDFHIETYQELFIRAGSDMLDDAIYKVEYGDNGQVQLIFIAQE